MTDTPDRRYVFDAYGVVCAVDVRHTCALGSDTGAPCGFGETIERIADRLPPGARPMAAATSSVATVDVECRGGDVVVTGEDGEARAFGDEMDVLHTVDGAIRSIIAVHAPGLVFIHAGSVAVDGRVVVLPGRSMAGKTTLVAAMVEAGATYLSDEYAVFDADGMVHPYPRRLSLRVGGGRREVAAAELGGATASGPLPVGLVASITYDAPRGWQVESDGQAACADALISNAVAARVRPSEVLAVTAKVARSVEFVRGTRGEAADAVTELCALVASAADPTVGDPR